MLPATLSTLLIAFCLSASPCLSAAQNGQDAKGGSRGQDSGAAPPAPQGLTSNNAVPPTPPPAGGPHSEAGADAEHLANVKKAEAGKPAVSEAGATIPAPAAPIGSATLKISIRTADDTPFTGLAKLKVVSQQGAELSGKDSADAEGETVYSELPPGSYAIEATSPGFTATKQSIEIEPGKRTQTLFLIMKPELAAEAAGNETPASTSSAKPNRKKAELARGDTSAPAVAVGWAPASIDAYKPTLVRGASCSLPAVLGGVSARMTQFVANLQKFSATEHIEHYPIDYTGKRLIPQTRNFDYVAQVSTLPGGSFSIDEYRNGGFDRTRFPANIATEGVAAMALIFHPVLAPDFEFRCEGLETWNGRPAWLVHYAQREDRPSRIGGYRTLEHYYPFYFKGLAWVDAASYQVLRLQTELAKPIPEVGLTQQLIIINYGAVAFHSRKLQLWLPQSAELYMQRRSNRFYRVHTFGDFKIYTVDTDQSIHAPKESYCFTNTSDHDIAGILTVSPASGISLKAVSIQFTIPPGRSIYKLVGPGKDIGMPVEEVGAATFMYDGPAGSIKADAYLVKESTLDLVPETPISANP